MSCCKENIEQENVHYWTLWGNKKKFPEKIISLGTSKLFWSYI